MKVIILLAIAVILAAAGCAPADLDITPTIEATATQNAEQAAQPTATDPAAENDAASLVIVDQLIAAVPATIPAGSISWRKTSDPTEYLPITNGSAGRIKYTGVGGGALELTLSAFDTPEAAQVYYDEVIGRTRNLENAKPRDQFPQPNLFGVSTYGSAAIFIQGKIVMFASVPQFPSTAGDPLSPLSRQLFMSLGTLIDELK